ncbi:MAG TPA: lyase family protein, partial [Candidatus Lokiarchaeia archaeon]|nr:lyase family protein [Candidatus Lokiarchaeia archaeon]
FEVYERQLALTEQRINKASEELNFVPLGGTAIGTGIDAPREFAPLAVQRLAEITKFPLEMNPIKSEGMASHAAIVNVSGALRSLALALVKLANDVRLLGSGPRAGLAELILPPNEPGSSIMPGKINPTQCEAMLQACFHVIGGDLAVTFGEAFGSMLDLNVMKPLMISNLVDGIELLANAMGSFVDHCLDGLEANTDHINQMLDQSLMVVTHLTPIIGYDKAGEIALIALKSGKTIREVIIEMGLEIEDLDDLLDPRKMV